MGVPRRTSRPGRDAKSYSSATAIAPSCHLLAGDIQVSTPIADKYQRVEKTRGLASNFGVMRRRLRLLALSAALLSASAGGAWAIGKGLTLGQIGADTACGAPGDMVAAQTSTSGGVSYTVPTGKWRIVWWSAAGPSDGKMALVVFRPTGTTDEYQIVGSSTAHSLPAAKNKFSAEINVREGDLIGLWAKPGTLCGVFTGNASDTASIYFPTDIPEAGTTMTLIPGYAVGYQLNVKVALTKRP